MAGEMFKSDIEEGGDWHSVRKEMEEIGREAGAVVKVEPFDQCQGPKGKVFFGSNYIGTLWVVGDNEWHFVPEINIKITLVKHPVKSSKSGIVTLLRKIKKSFPSHKSFEVIPGQKPSHYSTPPLKKAQQKSLLHLIKSKYQIVEAKLAYKETQSDEADSALMTESDKFKKFGPVVKTFKSSSNPNKTYEVRQLKGEDPTCNCPGWANRRTCKHCDAVKHGKIAAMARKYLK